MGKKAYTIIFLNGILICVIADSPRTRKGETPKTSEDHCAQRADFLLFGS